MTPTEKKYSKLVGEIYEYNTRYWHGWEDNPDIIMVMVAGIHKDEYNGRYFYTLQPIGKCDFEWMLPTFNAACSEFVLKSRSRLYDVGACAPAAPVSANAVPTIGV